jgi:hypothetical protein
MMRGDVSARSDRIYICSSRYTIHLLKIQSHGNVSAAGLHDYCWTQEINRPGVSIQTSSSSLQRPGRHGAGFRCCRTSSCVPIKFPRGLVRFETSTNPHPRQQICVNTPRHPVDSAIEAGHGRAGAEAIFHMCMGDATRSPMHICIMPAGRYTSLYRSTMHNLWRLLSFSSKVLWPN